MKSPIQSIVLLAVLLQLSLAVNALEYKTTFPVGPNDNGKRWIQNELMVGDTMKVTITAQTGYKLVSAQVTDGNGLSWAKDVFTFTSSPVPATMAKETRMEAKWTGELQPDSKGGGGGKKGPTTNLPWNLTGLYMLLGEHEGFGSDKGRTPPGALTSKKPGPPPVFVPGLTYDEVAKKWKSPFASPADHPEMVVGGNYDGNPYTDDACKVAIACPPGTEIKDCPDCAKKKVTFVYLCCGGDKVGGDAFPDIIKIATYTPEPELSTKKALRDELAAKISVAEKKVTDLNTQIAALNAQRTTAQANLAAAIEKYIFDKTEKQRKAVTDAQKIVDDQIKG